MLDCCYAVSRGGRRVTFFVFLFYFFRLYFSIDLTGLRESGVLLQRFGNMAGVFQVMAFSVGALETGESDEAFMGKLAKIATAEIISSKVCVCVCVVKS